MSNKFMSKVKALCKKAKDTLEAKTAVMKANAHTPFVGTVAEVYDLLEVKGDTSIKWKDILAIYAIKITSGEIRLRLLHLMKLK